MKAVVCTKRGEPVAGNVEFREDWPDAGEPGWGEVRLRTLASAFNQMDLWVGRGVPGLDLTYPRVSGCDACGVVGAVGEGVDEAWLGRRVVFRASIEQPTRLHPDDPSESTVTPNYELIGEHHHGGHREQFIVPVANIADVGDADPIETAAFGLCTLTAWSGMVTKGRLSPGQSVLITGIGGGVATSALAIAKHFGCPVAVTSRHQWKLDRATELGADFAVLDEGQDWSRQVRGWSNKRGVDMAMDSSGKATHLKAIKSLARGGAYICPGATSGSDATTDLARLFWNQLRLLGTTMGLAAEFAEVAALFRAGKIRPVVDKVYMPQQCKEAYARLEAGEQFGKIVMKWAKN